ncbi:MAG: hypothetical protein ACM3WV_01620 [Bacillota bacterium]
MALKCKKSLLFMFLAAFAVFALEGAQPARTADDGGVLLSFDNPAPGRNFKPLETVRISTDAQGVVSVSDGAGREYFRASAAPEVSFALGGFLGRHTISQLDAAGKEKGRISVNVNCETGISGNAHYRDMLDVLYRTMSRGGAPVSRVNINGKTYSFFVSWLRDHVHVLKSMRYFEKELKTGMELYKDYQRADGMIWDNFNRSYRKNNYWELLFKKGGFAYSPDGSHQFTRIPVEADVEYLYVEGIYNTWRATGDDAWMKSMLDSAIKAMEYSRTSPYRWSKKYDLIKRGFTIDTWDFQSDYDVKISGNIMTVDPVKTQFGIMHGDNTGFAQSCRFLAMMLEAAGRKKEAARYARLGGEILNRLNKLSWNGRFYTHHVPENPDFKRDLGVDFAEQISLSNAYALNRGLTHRQCAAIIKEYLRIKADLPVGSVGEWYTIYPPFERFNDGTVKWQYMNGGVVSIVAGELARGAFENGFEEYAVDILERIHAIAKKHGNYLNCTFTGQISPRPETKFTPLDLSTFVNTGVRDGKSLGSRDFQGLPGGGIKCDGAPFIIANSGQRDGGICLALSDDICTEASIPVGGKTKSIYFLHAMTYRQAGGEKNAAGMLVIEYADGTSDVRYLREGEEIVRFNPSNQRQPYRGNIRPYNCKLAWQGTDAAGQKIWIGAYALDNPFPEKEITRIKLASVPNGNTWLIFAITMSDQEAYFPPDEVSFGIPDSWGAAAVAYGLVEGLAGVVDGSRAFDEVVLSPRWAYTDAERITVTVKYPASDGYVSYRYRHDKTGKQLALKVTGSGSKYRVHCLLPRGAKKGKKVVLNGRNIPFRNTGIGESRYVDFILPEGAVSGIVIEYV